MALAKTPAAADVRHLFSGAIRVGWNDFSLPAVGERFDNDDGTSRQDELARCQPGEMIHLVREPHNRHDPGAVALITERGVCVGYLGRERAQWIGSKIDRGYDARAIIERIKGRGLAGSPLGLVIRLNLDPHMADEPELPAKPAPRRMVA